MSRRRFDLCRVDVKRVARLPGCRQRLFIAGPFNSPAPSASVPARQTPEAAGCVPPPEGPRSSAEADAANRGSATISCAPLGQVGCIDPAPSNRHASNATSARPDERAASINCSRVSEESCLSAARRSRSGLMIC